MGIMRSGTVQGATEGYAAMLPTVNSTWYAVYGKTIFWPSCSITPAFNSAVTSRCTARKSRPTRLASSRIDIASAPVIVLIMASRLGASIVLASDSISGKVRENGTSTGCPDIAATNAALVSSLAASRDITRTVSVVMVLPSYSVDVGVKLFEQVSEVGERHRVFIVADMLMITLASFIVIAHNANIIRNVGHAVLIAVVTGANRGLNCPDCNADKGVFPWKDIAFFDEQLRWHCVFSLNDDNNSITFMAMSNVSSLDSLNSERYSVPATTLLVVGCSNPEFTRANDRAYAVFLCVKHCHIRIMVGRAGQPSGWPGSLVTGIATPVRLATHERSNSGGELKKLTREAAIMATIPALTQPEITFVNGRAVTTSLAVAAYFHKLHKNVLVKISCLNCSPEFNARNFSRVEYIDTKGEHRPAYQITRDGFAFLAMSFTGKRAAHFKEMYITAFNAMEQALIQRSRKTASGLESIHNHAQRLHENLSILMAIWADNVQPLNPPIVVSGTVMDACHRSGLIAAGIARAMRRASK